MPAARNASARFGFTTVTPRQSIRMPGIRISRDELSFFAGVACNLRDQFGRQETLAIIFEDNRVDLRKILSNRCNDLFNLCRRWSSKLLAVDTHDLLMARDDAGFNDRAKRLILNALEMSIFCSDNNSRICRPLRSLPSNPITAT